jgi:outer membrane protein TolC
MSPPATAQVRILAAEIRHPILQPVRLDPAEGLSPDAAGVLAVLLNPSLRAVRDQRALADAQLLQAELLPDPEFSYDLERPVGGDTAGTVNGFGLALSWNAASLIARSAQAQGAKGHRAAVETDVAWQEWQVAQAARTAVFQLAGLQSQIALQEQTREHLADNLDLIRKAVASGTMTAKELSAAESASRQAYATLLDLKKQAEQQRLQVNRLLGLPPQSPVRLSDRIELPVSFKPPTPEEVLADLEQRRLDLVALRHGYDSQEAAVRAAVLNQFPRLRIGPTVGRDVENVDTVGFGLAVDLPIFNRNRGGIAVEQATRQKLFDEYMNRVFETQSDVYMLLSRIRFLNEEIAAAQQAEPLLQKLEENYRAALSAGRADILTYYAAWDNLTANRMKLIVLKGQLAGAVVALESATGRYRIEQPHESPPADSEEVKP